MLIYFVYELVCCVNIYRHGYNSKRRGFTRGLQSALHLHTVRLLTEGDDTRGCGDTIGPPDDEQRAARNMLRSVVRGEFRPRQTRQLPRAVDLKGRLLSSQSY